MLKHIRSTLFLSLLATTAFAQIPAKAPANWFNLDFKTDSVRGVSTEKTYQTLLKGKKSKPVIVAVIDGGVDINHEDLNSVLWTNPKEIAGNGKDDDKNGYIDDIHGWNFIGGKDGRNINFEATELTRLFAPLADKYANADSSKVTDKKEYARYLELKAEYDKEYNKYKKQYDDYNPVVEQLTQINNLLKQNLKMEKVDINSLSSLKSGNPQLDELAINLVNGMNQAGVTDMDGLISNVSEDVNHLKEIMDYGLNLNYNPRDIVGDNYADQHERYYGNNDVKGPDASHGTHVAGIIAANRTNNIGMSGIANNVKIMSVRTVPNGDERDKDVANAIRYAVDNGAKVINMSFGKSFSYDKSVVDEAVKYAESKDVLLVHAAGNDASNNDTKANFPNSYFADGSQAKNWIEVGALSWKKGEDAIATFSNYGKKNVDVFAPGVDIYSTIPESQYKNNSGTSMASPVVAGIAAVLRSYFPNYTAAQIKDIILRSAVRVEDKVKMPVDGGDSANNDIKLVNFSDLCNTGAVVNLYEAVKLAQNYKAFPLKPISTKPAASTSKKQ
ncbi:S8 family peptidase [Solitalea koreensis]|uniref:Serine protease, subtilisin family n=1 Tax=Solitalea koreensis TaxID=543615 RepID=A0A521AX61_9SPHI|nr:S8 family peptidase [Solitalea koreensis]SMO39428.1 Serine protease, subtilisin family [Solitalea koreensis]